MRVLGWELDWLLQDTEEELYSQYRTDVVDCHPFEGLPPITFDEFKKIYQFPDVEYIKNQQKIVSPIHFVEYPEPSDENIIIL